MANFKPDKKVINKQNRQKRRRDLLIHYRLERDVGSCPLLFVWEITLYIYIVLSLLGSYFHNSYKETKTTFTVLCAF